MWKILYMVLVLFVLIPASIADQNHSTDRGTDWLSPNSVHSIYPSDYYHTFTPYVKPIHTITDYYPVYTYSYYNNYYGYYSNYNSYYWNNVWTLYDPVYSYSYYYTNYYYLHSYPYFGYGIIMA